MYSIYDFFLLYLIDDLVQQLKLALVEARKNAHREARHLVSAMMHGLGIKKGS